MKKIRRTKVIKRTTTELVMVAPLRDRQHICPLCGSRLFSDSNQKNLLPESSVGMVIDVEPINPADPAFSLNERECGERESRIKKNKI